MNLDSMGALEVLKEIKALMDERLGSKFASPVEDLKEEMQEEMSDDAKGLEVSKVKVVGKDPKISTGDEMEEGSDVDPEMLKKIRQTLG